MKGVNCERGVNKKIKRVERAIKKGGYVNGGRMPSSGSEQLKQLKFLTTKRKSKL